ncbi:MAG: hypothetical protein Q7J25_02850 [Vicinamibacterales bacterium]|nr:hypothetical protein [Vicinamibacterales bacterium]
MNVESLMRDIRARIARQHGVDLSEQQIQELAARRLESILDVRSVNPALMEQLRRSVSSERAAQIPSRVTEPPYQFEDTTIYDSDSGLTRTLRRLLNPLLKLLFNPNPIIRALHVQAGLNIETARREAERDQRQAEWNALHYELLQRLVTEVSRVSVEVQALGPRIEALSAKVDFNERRVRAIEGQQQDTDTRPSAPPARLAEDRGPGAPSASAGDGVPAAGDGTRKRRRRRRGRRSGAGDGFIPAGSPQDAGGASLAGEGGADTDLDDGDDTEDSGEAMAAAPVPERALAQPPAEPAPDAAQPDATPAAPEPERHDL